MTTSSRKQNYIVMMPMDPIPDGLRGPLARAWLDAQDTKNSNAMIAFSGRIRNEVMPNHEINIIHDGSGFRVEGHPHQYASFIYLETTAEGAEAIAALDPAVHVGIDGTFYALDNKPAPKP